MSTLAAFLVAVNPPAIAAALAPSVRMRAITTSALLSAALAIVTAGLSEPVLDLLDVSAPTFRLAAGVVLAIAGVRWIALGARPTVEGAPRAVELLPVFLTPQLVAIALTTGADDGVAAAALAGSVALVVAVIAACWRGRGLLWWSWAARLVGVGGLAVGLSLVVDGVKTV